jgi:hypothetical protein
MPVRSLSRALKSTVAAGALALAIPGAAFAMPASPNPDAPAANASGNVTAGTDVAAPDQQNPLPAPGSRPVAAPVAERPRIVSIDRGAETLAVVAIAAAALLAGAGAGFAGGRRLAVRTG